MVSGDHDAMKTRLTIDGAGRIVLPQEVRKRFHLARGSSLKLEIGADAILLRPRVHEAVLVEEHGLLVHEGERSGDLVDVVESVRRRRDRDMSGELG